MNFKSILLLSGAIFFYTACTSNAHENTENTESTAIIEEIQQIDSLSNELDSTIHEIEVSTRALDKALQDLDD